MPRILIRILTENILLYNFIPYYISLIIPQYKNSQLAISNYLNILRIKNYGQKVVKTVYDNIAYFDIERNDLISTSI